VRATIYVDGASRGNPGPASCAAIIQGDGFCERQIGLFLGNTTNNVAEYCGFLLALTEAKNLGVDEVTLYSDSNLCVRQVKGEFRVTSSNLVRLHQKVMRLTKAFRKWDINHIPREKNQKADLLSNRILDLQKLIR